MKRARALGITGDEPSATPMGPAPETTPGRQAIVRARIRSTELIALLEAHVFREKYKGRMVTLSPDRLTAIRILLAKSIPDVARVEHAGDPDAPVRHVHEHAQAVAGATDPTQASLSYERMMRGPDPKAARPN